MRRALDRVIVVVADLAAFGWFRSVERSGMNGLPRRGPVLVVANHGGGFVDPALLASALPRMPRFLVMARLRRYVITRPLLALVGAIPVQRAEDGDTTDNVHAFAACHEVLRAGGVVAIFPEGRASDEPHLLPMRTGAARIALSSRTRGASRLVIVPVGIIYEDKTRARSRAYVRVGEPLALDDEIGGLVDSGASEDDDNHAAVHALTERIRERLARAALDYRDAAQLAALGFAAEVTLRPDDANPAWEPPLGDIEDLAGRLAASPDEVRLPARRAVDAYRAALEANAVDDPTVASEGDRRFRRMHAGAAVVALILVPFAVAGLLANVVPALAVVASGRRPMAPVTRATVKFLLAFVGFPLTWGLIAFWLSGRVTHPLLVTALVGPVCGLAALALIDRVARARRAHLDLRRFAGIRSSLADLQGRRHTVAGAVRAAASDDRSRW